MYGRFLKNEKGSALLMAIMGFAVISIITVTAVFMGSTNAKQTHTEGKRTQAYYVADIGAKTMIKELQGLPADKLKDKLIEMKGKGIIEGSYTDDTSVGGTPTEYKFELEVTQPDVTKDIYELRSTGYTNDGTGVKSAKDGTRVIIPLEEKGSTGYGIGDGKIFLSKKDGDSNLQIPLIPQMNGNGVSIYTGMTKSGDKEPIFINDGDSSKLFSRNNDQDVSVLNKETKKADTGGTYSLKVLEPSTGKISTSNPIKKEHLIRTDVKGQTIELNYGAEKGDIINYFSMEQLKGNEKSSEITQDKIDKIFMLPIETIAEYENYIKAMSPIYPPSKMKTFQNGPNSDSTTLTYMTASSPLKKEVTHDLRGKTEISLPELAIAEGGILNLQVSGGTNIYINGKLAINDATKSPEFNIITDGLVNIYLTGDAQPDGNIIVSDGTDHITKKSSSNGINISTANLYMNGKTFQTNNKAKISGVNLYNPTGNVHLGNNIEFQGIIVAKHLQLKDTATFRAPSKGGGPASMNKEWELGDLEWKEWQQ